MRARYNIAYVSGSVAYLGSRREGGGHVESPIKPCSHAMGKHGEV